VRELARRFKLGQTSTTNMIIVASSDMMAEYGEKEWERRLRRLTKVGVGQGRR
jgi:hypothetical protein